MLFKAPFHAGIVDGSITRTFRRWKRLQVVPGNRYRQPFGEVEVVAAKEVAERSITAHDAELAGYTTRETLLAELAKYPEGTLYRIDFRFAGADQRIALREKDDLSLYAIRGRRSTSERWTQTYVPFTFPVPALDRHREPWPFRIRNPSG